MAKRAAPDEKPYRPLLDADLVSAALSNAGPDSSRSHSSLGQSDHVASAKILEMPQKADAPRRTENAGADLVGLSSAGRLSSDLERPRQNVPVIVEKFDHEKRILFTRPEAQSIDRLVVSLATRLNSQVKVSHVIRALVGLLLHAEGEMDKRAGEAGPVVRPANGDVQGLQRFEKQIGQIIAAALRDAGPVR